MMLFLPEQATLLKAPAPLNSPANAFRPARLSPRPVSENTFDLTAFGAVGDGVADDGPALQSALDAIAAAGGGTLFVPAGRYAINTPVVKNFAGLATSLTIQGVESSTPVPPPNSPGAVLTRGLDLVSEFAPRTGQFQYAVTIAGLETFLIKDIVFIGTPGVANDALVTLALNDISDATIRHCEFYGLSSLVAGGAIVQAVRSHLTFEQSVVLGSTCNSGHYTSVIQNLEWKGITISEAVFADYGQRPELYGKMTTSPYSWVRIGNAAAPDNDSPRREVVFRSVMLDEGGYVGISSYPGGYTPPSAPIDLLYVTGLYMNVSNLGTTGHYLDRLQRVLIEKSHYGWSHNTDSAIHLLSVGNAIIDETECVDDANRIRADAETGKLTVINSVYASLDSAAQITDVITTSTADEDPVQHVRQQFMATLGRAPDAAAHFYWSDQILQCGADTGCVLARRAALATYLGSEPSPKFAVTGQVTGESGAGLPGVTVTLSGSQFVTTTTDSAGQYHFSNLPTSGVYTVTPTLQHHTLNPLSRTIVTPAGDQVFDSSATFNHHTISGHVADAAGVVLSGVTVTLSGAQNATVITGTDGNYSFEDLPAGGIYTVSPRKTSYTFSPANQTFQDLGADQNLNFTSTFVTYTIAGRVVGVNNNPMAGVTLTLSGSQNGTTTSDNTGNFAFTGLPSEGSYTLTPLVIGYSFNPSSRNFNNLAANHYHDYLATYTTHSISGRVTDAASGTALSGAVVTLSGYTSASTTTDANGNYSFGNLPAGGTYTVTVAKTDYTFAQPSQTFANLTSNQTANFAATLNRHSITGRATASDGSALAGVSVTLSGSQTSSATTDSNGAYSFLNLPAGGSYTVGPSLPFHSFTPASQTYTNLAASQQGSFVATLNTHTISGRLTDATGIPIAGAAVALSGSLGPIATITTGADGNYAFGSLPAGTSYVVAVSKLNYIFNPASRSFSALNSNQTADFSATLLRVIEFSTASYSVSEGTAAITITVTRTGDTSGEATVTYSASNGTGTQGKDLNAVIGQVTFAPGETSKTFAIFIIDDAFVENDEQLTVTLSDPQGAILGTRASATLTIDDNDSGAANPNPVDDAQFFVRQHYRDFLSREPDPAGLSFWSDQIVTCGTNAACVEDRRINVSAAFFLSIEFQETGFMVHRLYKASFARPPQHLDEFLLDTRTIAQGVVVNAPGWQQLLEDNKAAFVNEFVERPDFSNQYPLSLTPAQFVNLLNTKAGGPLSADGLAAAVAEFNGSPTSSETVARARVLRLVAESETFSQRELSPAFVLMQYFGYLQRNPSDLPDSNLDGYNFWLSKLNEFGGDFYRAQMVKSFLVSGEYRSRFGL